jgi:sterol desaturase/sphingolipid hydroxylase (fatty acid hydroxylase superfamily)
VHHASNEDCLDRNYGSILIVFDRMFGTFAQAPLTEPLRFGLKERQASNNPVHIALSEWRYLWRDFRAAPSLGAKARALFGPP